MEVPCTSTAATTVSAPAALALARGMQRHLLANSVLLHGTCLNHSTASEQPQGQVPLEPGIQPDGRGREGRGRRWGLCPSHCCPHDVIWGHLWGQCCERHRMTTHSQRPLGGDVAHPASQHHSLAPSARSSAYHWVPGGGLKQLQLWQGQAGLEAVPATPIRACTAARGSSSNTQRASARLYMVQRASRFCANKRSKPKTTVERGGDSCCTAAAALLLHNISTISGAG